LKNLECNQNHLGDIIITNSGLSNGSGGFASGVNLGKYTNQKGGFKPTIIN
jgi:hypothetical protein